MGISAAIGTFLEGAAGSIFGVGGALGVAGTAIGTGLIEGAALGALTSAVSGGDPGMGALGGALTGGIGAGVGGELATLGVNGNIATALGDTLGGLTSAAATGKPLGQGALGGLESGIVSDALGGAAKPFGSSAPSAPTPGGGTTSAAAAAAPASISGTSAIDPNAINVSAGPVSATAAGLPSTGANLPGADLASPLSSSAPLLGGASNTTQTVGSGITGTAFNGAASGGGASDISVSAAPVTAAGAGLGAGATITGTGTAGEQFSNVPAPSGATPSPLASNAAAATTGSTNMNVTPAVLNDPAPTVDPSSYLQTPDQLAADASLIASAPSGGLLSGGGKLLSNPKTDITLAGMAGNLLMGNKPPAYSGQLLSEAQLLAGQSNQLTSYLTSGALPPGVQDSINQATAAAQAQIRSHYAARGMSGSSAEAQDLQNIAQQASAQGATIAEQLYKQGITDMGLSEQIYAQLMTQAGAQDRQAMQAISSLAGALGGMATQPTQQSTLGA